MTKEHLQATVEELETLERGAEVLERGAAVDERGAAVLERGAADLEGRDAVGQRGAGDDQRRASKKVEELDAANSDLQNLLHSTRIPTLFLDGQLRIKRFTDAANHVFRLIGTDVGRPITDITNRFEGEIVPDLKEVLATLAPRERKVRLADQSASYLLRILPYRRVDDVIDGLVVTFLDVTALEEAQRQSARLAAIVEWSHDAIVGRGLDGEILSWNQAAESMFGYLESEALGRPLSLIVPTERQRELGSAFERIASVAPRPPFEMTLVRKNGRGVDVSVGISPIKDGDGSVIGASAIFRDITDLKRAQEALKEEARHKDEFLALLSHELRNPLAPMRSCLDVIRHPDRAPDQVETCLRIMDRQLSHLTGLVDQLMDASRIASGKIQLDLRDEDLCEVVRAAVEDERRIVESAHLRLDLRLPDRQLWIRADHLRLSQVVANLIGNAAKFTDAGGSVTVSVDTEDNHYARVRVTDTGVGLESREVEQIFRPFAQSESGLHRPRGGLGLGLAVVRALVEAHGGRVEARSEGKGQGSEFVVTLPMQAERVSRRRATGAAALGGAAAVPRRVLIIEDNRDAAEGLQALLRLFGHTVEVAHDGPTGLARAETFRPEAVLCDIGLPGLTGYDVAEALRASEDLRSVYLVALTGFDQPGDQQRTREAGFDQHITKPVDVQTLRRLLEEMPVAR